MFVLFRCWCGIGDLIGIMFSVVCCGLIVCLCLRLGYAFGGDYSCVLCL